MYEVYQYRSTAKAAAFVHMSQPAVTGAVAACEKDLGLALFTRNSRGMEPTRAGHVFCARIGAAIGHLKAAESLLRQKKTKFPLHRLVSEGQLRALSAVIDTGGFSQAARRLGLSQPSVHRAARELETLCGVPLWKRDGATVDPTAEARILSRFGGLALAEIQMGIDELNELQGVIEGALTIGTLPLATSKWLPKAVSLTLTQYPQAKLRIIDGPYDEQLKGLLHGELDMILGALREPAPSPDIEQELIFRDPLVIVLRADHALAREFDELTPAQLDRLGWILPRSGTPARANFETFMTAKGLPPARRVVECSSLTATRGLLLQSDYAALLSRQQVEADIALNYLKIMGPPLIGSTRPIGIARRRGFKPTRLHAVFLDHLRQVANDQL